MLFWLQGTKSPAECSKMALCTTDIEGLLTMLSIRMHTSSGTSDCIPRSECQHAELQTAPSALAELLRQILPYGGPGKLVNSFVFAGHRDALAMQCLYRIEMQLLHCLPEPPYLPNEQQAFGFRSQTRMDRVNPPETERRLSMLFPLLRNGYRMSRMSDINHEVCRGTSMLVLCQGCGDPILSRTSCRIFAQCS